MITLNLKSQSGMKHNNAIPFVFDRMWQTLVIEEEIPFVHHDLIFHVFVFAGERMWFCLANYAPFLPVVFLTNIMIVFSFNYTETGLVVIYHYIVILSQNDKNLHGQKHYSHIYTYIHLPLFCHSCTPIFACHPQDTCNLIYSKLTKIC